MSTPCTSSTSAPPQQNVCAAVYLLVVDEAKIRVGVVLSIDAVTPHHTHYDHVSLTTLKVLHRTNLDLVTASNVTTDVTQAVLNLHNLSAGSDSTALTP